MPKQTEIDYTAISYVALKPMKVGTSTRQIGDPVPEAAGWRNLSNYISSGYLGVVNMQNHPGVPTGIGAKSRVGKAEGNAEYTHYRPVDHTGAPAVVASDAH